MLIGNTATLLVLITFGTVVPCYRMLLAKYREDQVRQKCWMSFFMCLQIVVVPLLYVPSWIWFRNELMVSAVFALSASDAILSDYFVRTYVECWFRQTQSIGSLLKYKLEAPPPVQPPSSDDEKED